MNEDAERTIAQGTVVAPPVSSDGLSTISVPSQTMDAPGVSVADPANQATLDSGGAGPDAFADAFTGSRVHAPKLSERIGRYYPLKLLGEGGMGAVYKAEQREPIKRLVALKIIRIGHESAGILARFDSERQALARMDHPAIAKVLDAGSDNGLPFFVMEYVPGVPITEFADQNCLSLRARLELFLQVCDGISHAHSKALLHRDIKAQNVLAYMADGKPAVKVIDFGIAKAVGEEKLTNATLTANVGSVLGTPYAMSPEQADGSADLDTRTDVYALGVLLYELLGGRLPFALEELQRKTLREVLELVRLKEPPKLSTWLAHAGEKAEDIAKARDTKPAALIRDLKKELEWIPLKAMRKDRDRRYQSALQLAEDIENYMADRPLTAGPESRRYVVRKFVGRNKLRLATAAAGVALTIGAGTAYTIQIGRERDRAVRASNAAGGMVLLSKMIIQQASPEEGGATATVRQAVDNAVRKFDSSYTFATLDSNVQADLNVEMAAVLRDVGSFGEADELLRKALEEAQKKFGPNTEPIADIYVESAALKKAEGHLDGAMDYYEKAMEIYHGIPPQRSFLYAQALNGLGSCYLLRGAFEPATTQFNSSLSMLLAIEANDPVMRARAKDLRAEVLSNLGGVAKEQSNYDLALGYFQKSFEVRKQLSTPNEVPFAESELNLGNCYSALKRFDEAQPLLDHALNVYHDFGGDNWAKTLRCRARLATALRGQGKLADAEAQFRICISGFSSHPEMAGDLADAYSGLGKTLLLIPGRESEAEAPLLDAFEYRIKTKAPNLPVTVKALDTLYQKTNQPEKAKIIHDRLAASGIQ